MQKIHILSDFLVNQIAAGEVVQRPASVVKELIENAIDAESKTIKIIIKDAGKQLIQVQDDGIGMNQIDARMCFEKHATSKLASLSDLSHIQTMGFRGEAMASIAAVAQVEMSTRQHDEALGTTIVIEGSVIKKQEPTSTCPGTNIRVKNLFYNIPVRRNFLKSNPIEFKHILEEVQHAALARPDIGFCLYHNDIEIYQFSAEKLSHRIIHIFGDNYKKQLLPFEQETNILTLKGYLGKPEQAKKTRREQFLFVNQRFIKNPLLNYAIKNAYGRLLPADMLPFYVMYLTIDPQLIDINVHPTKTEIKFQDEKTIYALVEAVVKKTLATHHIDDSLDFDHNINYSPLQYTHPITISSQCKDSETHHDYTFKQTPTDPSAPNLENLFHTCQESSSPKAMIDMYKKESDQSKAIQLYGNYIVTQVQSGALLIDQQAAYERVLYDTFTTYFQNGTSSSQQLLIPEHIHLNPTDYMIILEHEPILRSIGFMIDPFGTSTIIVHGCPAELSHHVPKLLIEGLLEQFKCYNKIELSHSERIIRALTKKASAIQGKKLTTLEIDTLLAKLFSSSNTMYAPDGRKICIILYKETLMDLFK